MESLIYYASLGTVQRSKKETREGIIFIGCDGNIKSMFTIEFILPYTSLGPAVEQAFNEHPQRHNMSLRMSFIAHDRIKSSELQGDVIIARGLTALYLNHLIKGAFTVLEIPMTGYDIFRALQEGYDLYGDQDAALIATESVIYGFEEQMRGVNAKVRTYEIVFDSDMRAVIKKAIDDGAGFIVGGNEIVTLANDMGYKGIRIMAGRQSIRQVIDEAWKIHTTKLEEVAKYSKFNAVIENIDEGIIACDRDEVVTICNRYAQTLLGTPSHEIIGSKLSEVDASINDPPIRTLTQEEPGIFVKINGISLAVNRIPIFVEDHFESGIVVLQKLSNIQKLENEIRVSVAHKGLVARHTFDDIIGSSPVMTEIKQLAMNYSRVNANVLILGETGTGKELFAQSIHNASERRNKPFVAVNCAALPESILESELFGYVEGAFTGASKSGKAGLFELAHGGTLFLDEISEMSYSLQGRLLRVLAERSIMRLGDDEVIPIDVRIIAASNQDIENLVTMKKFREDLFYRLDVLRLVIPPLRDRVSDIPAMMDAFLSNFDKKNGTCKHMIEPDIFPYLESLQWPGNVRQLRNLSERLSAMVFDSVITMKSIDIGFFRQQERVNEPVDERDMLIAVLSECGGNKSQASLRLGVDRSTLYRKLRKYGLL